MLTYLILLTISNVLIYGILFTKLDNTRVELHATQGIVADLQQRQNTVIKQVGKLEWKKASTYNGGKEL